MVTTPRASVLIVPGVDGLAGSCEIWAGMPPRPCFLFLGLLAYRFSNKTIARRNTREKKFSVMFQSFSTVATKIFFSEKFGKVTYKRTKTSFMIQTELV